jgi:hypothetical protein
MKKGIVSILLFFILMSAPCIFAQDAEPKSNVFTVSSLTQKPKGIFDFLMNSSKFSMSHSYSVSFLSLGGRSFNQGLYLNTMNFQFSDPLTAQVRVGFMHQPFGGQELMDGKNGKLFLERVMLRYQPSENTVFKLDFQSYPASAVSPYYYRW